MIPRIIHIVALNKVIPARYQQFLSRWNEYKGPFELKVWDQAEIEKKFPRLVDVLVPMRWLSNFLRVRILHEFGGVYFDLDTEPYPGAGDALHAELDRHSIVACTIDGKEIVDNTPMAVEAEFPGWGVLIDSDPGNLIKKWRPFVDEQAGQIHIMDGAVWSADEFREGVFVVHHRYTLRRFDGIDVIRDRQPSTRGIYCRNYFELSQIRSVRRIARSAPELPSREAALSLLSDGKDGRLVILGEGNKSLAVSLSERGAVVNLVTPFRPTLEDFIFGTPRDLDRIATETDNSLKAGNPDSLLIRDVPITYLRELDGRVSSIVVSSSELFSVPFSEYLKSIWSKLDDGGLIIGDGFMSNREIRQTVVNWCLLSKAVYAICEDGTWVIEKPDLQDES